MSVPTVAVDSAALIRGLRRPGNEPQLTQALAFVLGTDGALAGSFLGHVVAGVDALLPLPPAMSVSAEEEAATDRFDLRFRAPGWDVIVELKIHAGYGAGQLSRYLNGLTDVDNAYLVAITRDLPLYGEPAKDVDQRWLGSVRWRDLLPRMRTLSIQDELLRLQWQLFLDVLEEEGSMGFTRPQPELFDAFAQARDATRHMEEFLRVLEHPLLEALRDVLGGDEQAGLFWARAGRFARARHSNKIDIPFRVPVGGPWRVRAGVMGWSPPPTFYVSPAPDQRWTTRSFGPEARRAVDALVAGGNFQPEWMYAHFGLTEERIVAAGLEREVVEWAHDRFVEIKRSGLFDLPVEALGAAAGPDAEA